MTLRRKIMIYVALATLCLLAPLYFFSQRSLLQNYERMELGTANENVKINLLSYFDEYEGLGAITINYAGWDETHEFAGRPSLPAADDRYVTDNFPDSLFTSSRLNLTVLFNNRLDVYFAKAYDYAADKPEPELNDALQTLKTEYASFLRHPDALSRKKGMLIIGGRPLLAASYPIMTSNNEGPVKGTLLFGRYLDEELMNHIKGKSGIRMSVAAVPSGYRKPVNAQEMELAGIGKIPYWAEFGSDMIVSHILLADVAGKPAALLNYEHPRELVGEARQSVRFYFGCFGLAALVFFFTVSAILEKLIFARVNRAVSGINAIESRQDFSARIPVSGRDEFTKLECSFNHMMETLEQAQIDIRFQANHDPLTGLVNRNAFFNYLELRIRAAQKQNGRFAVLFIDLDRFKLINDTIGHQIGDKLLVEVSNRLSCRLRENDMLFRLGGDEFCVVSGDAEEREGIEDLAAGLKACINTHYDLGGIHTTISASIGISLYPEHGSDPETLLHHSDTAMLDAKDAGKNSFRWYSDEIEKVRSRRLLVERHLKHAIDRDELALYYQPKWDIRQGRIAGFEALLRWFHPELGHVSPGEFIPVAESSGLINELGEWIMRSACRQSLIWEREGFDSRLRIAINISGVQLLQPRFADRIRTVFEQEGVDPRNFELEVTESFAIANFGEVVDILGELRGLGFTISIDDFGAGYSSMKYLLQLPIHCMKIDKTLIDHLGHDTRSQVVVSTLIEMARRLDLTVVAEGVELPEQLRVLESYHCDQIQGYLLSKPLPAGRVIELLGTQLLPVCEG